ncbi:STAS domain-containing protein [Pseudonocardia xishanensis]|uniref:Anti-sigma factor antagonist n=1 Tax=Pseudonocardia xishanensis TaxID=630995 RepID=A0ABP8RYJ3_9PSEU
MIEAPQPDEAPLELAARTLDGGVLLVAVRGELDSATAPRATAALQRATTPGVRTLALDLSAVTFLASSGIQMLVSALRGDGGVDGDLHLVAPSDAVLRILRLLGLDQVFTIHDTVDDLVSAGSAGTPAASSSRPRPSDERRTDHP